MARSKMEIQIHSDKIYLDEVETFIRKFFETYHIQEKFFSKVLICVNEAVVNSVMHGNRFDAKKKVKIQSFTCHNYLYFRIIDEGEGFNYNDLPDPTDEKNLHSETGRGIYIIKNISDDISFSEKGNIIEFKIKINAND